MKHQLSLRPVGLGFVLVALVLGLSYAPSVDAASPTTYIGVTLASQQDVQVANTGPFMATLAVCNHLGMTLAKGTSLTFLTKTLKYTPSALSVNGATLVKVTRGKIAATLDADLADSACVSPQLMISSLTNTVGKKTVTATVRATLTASVGKKKIVYRSNSLFPTIGTNNQGSGGALKALTIKTPAKIKAGTTATATLSGLFCAPKEPLSVSITPLAGKVPTTRIANAKGAFSFRISGLPVGTYTVTVGCGWSGITGTGTTTIIVDPKSGGGGSSGDCPQMLKNVKNIVAHVTFDMTGTSSHTVAVTGGTMMYDGTLSHHGDFYTVLTLQPSRGCNYNADVTDASIAYSDELVSTYTPDDGSGSNSSDETDKGTAFAPNTLSWMSIAFDKKSGTYTMGAAVSALGTYTYTAGSITRTQASGTLDTFHLYGNHPIPASFPDQQLTASKQVNVVLGQTQPGEDAAQYVNKVTYYRATNVTDPNQPYAVANISYTLTAAKGH